MLVSHIVGVIINPVRVHIPELIYIKLIELGDFGAMY